MPELAEMLLHFPRHSNTLQLCALPQPLFNTADTMPYRGCVVRCQGSAVDLLTCELEEGAFQSQAGGCSRVVQLPPEMVRQLVTPGGCRLHQHLDFAALVCLHDDSGDIRNQIASMNLWNNNLGVILGNRPHTGVFSDTGNFA